MKVSFISVIFILFILLSNLFVCASTLNKEQNNINSNFLEQADIPSWVIGNFWKYQMDFVFTAKEQGSVKFSV